MVEDDGEHCVSTLSRLVFHPGVSFDDDPDGSKSVWTPDEDRVLALAVRSHGFDFAAAAKELSFKCDPDTCRRRWAELDLAVCRELTDRLEVSAKSLVAPAAVTPSGFNIFEDSIGEKITSIFSGVRASLPTIDLSDEENESDDETSCDEDVPTHKFQSSSQREKAATIAFPVDTRSRQSATQSEMMIPRMTLAMNSWAIFIVRKTWAPRNSQTKGTPPPAAGAASLARCSKPMNSSYPARTTASG